jgi:hypothetical protein
LVHFLLRPSTVASALIQPPISGVASEILPGEFFAAADICDSHLKFAFAASTPAPMAPVSARDTSRRTGASFL